MGTDGHGWENEKSSAQCPGTMRIPSLCRSEQRIGSCASSPSWSFLMMTDPAFPPRRDDRTVAPGNLFLRSVPFSLSAPIRAHPWFLASRLSVRFPRSAFSLFGQGSDEGPRRRMRTGVE